MTDNTDRVRLLLRVATKLSGPSDSADRAEVLRFAEELLSGSPSTDRVPRRQQKGLTLPLDIFVTYKHQDYSARLEPGWAVSYGDQRYSNPSAAARAVTANNVNGWRFWRYLDPYSGEQRTIESLRESTGVLLAQRMASNAPFAAGSQRRSRTR